MNMKTYLKPQTQIIDKANRDLQLGDQKARAWNTRLLDVVYVSKEVTTHP